MLLIFFKIFFLNLESQKNADAFNVNCDKHLPSCPSPNIVRVRALGIVDNDRGREHCDVGVKNRSPDVAAQEQYLPTTILSFIK